MGVLCRRLERRLMLVFPFDVECRDNVSRSQVVLMGCMVYVLVLLNKGNGGDGRSCSEPPRKAIKTPLVR
jgi:hypothetical protein